jgi:hypothetical protein
MGRKKGPTLNFYRHKKFQFLVFYLESGPATLDLSMLQHKRQYLGLSGL